MLRFDVLTIFPELFEPFQQESLLKKAREKRLLKIQAHNLRKWASDKHQTVDDEPYGGGLGMVMGIEPIFKAVQSLKSEVRNSKSETNSKFKIQNSRTILFSPRGKKFSQRKAFELAKYNQLVLICGRYEGVDERVRKYIADETISLGDFDLMGGEVPAMAVIETVSRLIPGVIGKPEFLRERIVNKGEQEQKFIEYPQYTRPEVFEPEPGVRWKVPKVLLSGDHKKIAKWRDKHKKIL